MLMGVRQEMLDVWMEASLYIQGLELASSYACQGKGFPAVTGKVSCWTGPRSCPYLTMRLCKHEHPTGS
jgi:hypothetical protein